MLPLYRPILYVRPRKLVIYTGIADNDAGDYHEQHSL